MTIIIAIKDIKNFFDNEKVVFLWLVVSLVICSFVLNYAYSFARFRGEMYDRSFGNSLPIYKIYSDEDVVYRDFERAYSEMDKAGLPQVKATSCKTINEEGKRIVGSTYISPYNADLTGLWVEGYTADINSTEIDACAVNEFILSYDNRLKMTGEKIIIDGEEYVIRGVYEPFQSSTDVVIFLERYIEKYGTFNEVWLTFDTNLSLKEENELVTIIKKYIAHGNMTFPESSSEESEAIVSSNEIQYSVFIVLLILFLAALVQYWFDANQQTYAVYWLNGASRKDLLAIAGIEVFVICTLCYLIGLALNLILSPIIINSSMLTLKDILLGLGVYFGSMILLSIVNMWRIYRQISEKALRGE